MAFSARVRFRLAVWRRLSLTARAGTSDAAHCPKMRLLAIAFTGSVAVAATTALLACGSRLPGPSYVQHPTEALVEVPYPPPPARVEYVPDRPSSDAVWLDGEWVWQGRRYSWKAGRWVKPPANASFAPWTTVRDSMGSLYLAEGTWRDRSGSEIAAPEPLASGTRSPGALAERRDAEHEEDITGVRAPESRDGSATKPDGGRTEETRAPRELIVDSGADPRVDAEDLLDGAIRADDASWLPEASGFDATFDAEPDKMRRP
jgi:hypothetical protein